MLAPEMIGQWITRTGLTISTIIFLILIAKYWQKRQPILRSFKTQMAIVLIIWLVAELLFTLRPLTKMDSDIIGGVHAFSMALFAIFMLLRGRPLFRR